MEPVEVNERNNSMSPRKLNMDPDESIEALDSVDSEVFNERDCSLSPRKLVMDPDESFEALDSVDSEVFNESLSHRRRCWLKLSATSFRTRVNSQDSPFIVRIFYVFSNI